MKPLERTMETSTILLIRTYFARLNFVRGKMAFRCLKDTSDPGKAIARREVIAWWTAGDFRCGFTSSWLLCRRYPLKTHRDKATSPADFSQNPHGIAGTEVGQPDESKSADGIHADDSARQKGRCPSSTRNLSVSPKICTTSISNFSVLTSQITGWLVCLKYFSFSRLVGYWWSDQETTCLQFTYSTQIVQDV